MIRAKIMTVGEGVEIVVVGKQSNVNPRAQLKNSKGSDCRKDLCWVIRLVVTCLQSEVTR